MYEYLPNSTAAAASFRCAIEAADHREATLKHLVEVKQSICKHRKEFKTHRLSPKTILICRPAAFADISARLDKNSII